MVACPPQNRVLTFRENKFAIQKTNPDCKPSEYFCDWQMRSPEDYSIEALFDRAKHCTNETKSAYALCNMFDTSDFHGFESYDKLFDFGRACGLMIGSPVICAVQYDSVYGYPRHITFYVPNAVDNVGTVAIVKLEIDPSDP